MPNLPCEQSNAGGDFTKPVSVIRLNFYTHNAQAKFVAIKKSDLYSSLWASCDELRGGMDASQYKDYVLFMLFINTSPISTATPMTLLRRLQSQRAPASRT